MVDLRRNSHVRQVLDTLAARGPGTDWEIAARANMTPDQCRRRRSELVAAGLVEDAGYRRQSPAGKPVIVWRVTSSGLAVIHPGSLPDVVARIRHG